MLFCTGFLLLSIKCVHGITNLLFLKEKKSNLGQINIFTKLKKKCPPRPSPPHPPALASCHLPSPVLSTPTATTLALALAALIQLEETARRTRIQLPFDLETQRFILVRWREFEAECPLRNHKGKRSIHLTKQRY